jgi:probable phosphoglycerate mutase
MDNRTIYLVRHGKIQLEDEQRRFIGQLDLPLNDEGVRQAQHLQKILNRADIGVAFCSDLRRARQTAEISMAGKNISIIARQGLREINMGEWEGCTFTDIARRFPHEFKARGADIAYYRVPGGESFADCSRRVIADFHAILSSSSGDILISSHAGVNRLLLCHILGMPLANLFRIRQDYGCLNVLQSGHAGFQAKLINFPGAQNDDKN